MRSGNETVSTEPTHLLYAAIVYSMSTPVELFSKSKCPHGLQVAYRNVSAWQEDRQWIGIVNKVLRVSFCSKINFSFFNTLAPSMHFLNTNKNKMQ